MRICIVGGAGFIGHNLALALKLNGHQVHIFDNLAINNLYNLTAPSELHRQNYENFIDMRLDMLREEHIPVHILDARHYSALSEAMGWIEPECIVQLAAVAHIDRSRKHPHSTFDNSLVTLENALDIAVQTKARKFVYFSSSTVYGDFQKKVVDETEPTNPVGTYGALKLSGEMLVKAYRHDKGLPYIIIRPQALYGPRCVSGRVTQVFVENALVGRRLVVHGNTRHDFTYIDDLIDGTVRAVENTCENETFNLTSESVVSVPELAEMVARKFGAKVEMGEPDPTKPARGLMSCNKARDMLGYAQRTPVSVGMAKYMTWYQGKWSNSPS